MKDNVRDHIKSFLTIESLLQRKQEKVISGSRLSISKMYKIYLEDKMGIGVQDTVTEYMYRYTFNHEFN